jgi:hypothetical protein
MIRRLAMVVALALLIGAAQAANEPPEREFPWTDLPSINAQDSVFGPITYLGADLKDARLEAAKLRRVDLRAADLRSAKLQGADLRGADLRGARLDGAELQGADLRDARLQGASLRGAKLAHVDLSRANLAVADLRGVDFFTEPDWDALAQIVELNFPARADRFQVIRDFGKARKREASIKGATLDRTLLDRPVCVFPPVSALDILHDFDRSKGTPVIASVEGAAPKQYVADRTAYFGELACNNKAGRVARAFASTLLTERRTPPTELGLYRAPLIKRLLATDCAGGATLPSEVKSELMQKKGAEN